MYKFINNHDNLKVQWDFSGFYYSVLILGDQILINFVNNVSYTILTAAMYLNVFFCNLDMLFSNKVYREDN